MSPTAGANAPVDDARQVVAQLQQRLEATPRAVRPLEHAMVRYQLGMAYAELPTGDRQMNLSRAVAAYDQAAAIFSPERHPGEHARVQNARGAALRELGQHGEAVAAFETALELLREADRREDASARGGPNEHGAVLNNLGLARSAVGDHESAVAVLGEAVAAFASAGETRQRSMARHNLAQAQDAAGDHQGAVETYRAGIEDTDAGELPYQWGLLQHGLGVSLTALGRSEAAVEAFTESLRVFTRQRYPFPYALAKNNLGLACSQRDDPTWLRRAVVAYEDALQVLDVRLHAAHREQVHRNLELAERALDERGEAGTRAEHLAALLAALDEDDRADLLRDRLMRLVDHPERQRIETLAELDLAVLRLDEGAAKRVTATWLNLLMELPNDMLIAGLKARIEALDHLDPDAEATAAMALESTIREELLAPQRIRVRDTLTWLGYERRW